MAVTLDKYVKNIEDAKVSIRNAIETKGVSVPNDAKIDTYASKIMEIDQTQGFNLEGTGWDTDTFHDQYFTLSSKDLENAGTGFIDNYLDRTREEYKRWKNRIPPAKGEPSKFFEGEIYLHYAPFVDTSNEENMDSFFNNCNELVVVPKLDLSKAKSVHLMFGECYRLMDFPSMDTSSVVDFSRMFYSCQDLEEAKYFDTSTGKNFQEMYMHCFALTYVPDYYTPNAENMKNMFYRCEALVEAPKLDTGKVKDMSGMFYGCSSLKAAPEMNTIACQNFDNLFSYCENLTSIPKYKTGNVRTMNSMFEFTRNLKEIPEMETRFVRSMNKMFNSSKIVKIPLLSTEYLEEANGMFELASDVTTLGGFDLLSIDLDLSYCRKLTKQSILNVFNHLKDVKPQNRTLSLSRDSEKLLNPQDTAIAIGKGWLINYK